MCVTFNTIQVLLYIKYNPKRSTEKSVSDKDKIMIVSVDSANFHVNVRDAA